MNYQNSSHIVVPIQVPDGTTDGHQQMLIQVKEAIERLQEQVRALEAKVG